MGRADPVGALVAEFGATDLRPSATVDETVATGGSRGPTVVSGPNDLIELRLVVERVTGPGSWFTGPGAEVDGTTRRGHLDLARPAQVMGLVVALEGIVRDNGGAWRTWKTTVEAIAAGAGELESLTLEALVLDVS